MGFSFHLVILWNVALALTDRLGYKVKTPSLDSCIDVKLT